MRDEVDGVKTRACSPTNLKYGTERLRAIRDDFNDGILGNPDLQISGEVFGNFVVLAREAMSNNHKNVAAVLASAALEDALKRYAISEGLNVEGKPMTEVISALKSKGLVSGGEKKILDTMPNLRNNALHADWDKIKEQEVGSMIGYVEQFLLSKFS